MAISSLRITDFRNLASVDLKPCQQGLNILYGKNGSGKTSFLEAIHYLGSGRSFRTATSSRLIRQNASRLSIFAQVLSDNQRFIPVGVERESSGQTRMRMAESEVASIADLAGLLPIRIINSQSHSLFESGPIFRRKYLDWGLFYLSESFLPCWRSFERALKQRNAVLRDKRPKKELDAWTEELLKHGLEFDRLRREYIHALTPVLMEAASQLLSLSNLDISYDAGWDESQEYSSVLSAHYPEEFRLGHTQYGPHRADLELKVEGVSAKHFLSRGQQKLLICAMILAQGMLLAKHANKRLIYLVDDLPSELDLHSKQKLISLLSEQQTQIFITAIESETICDFISAEKAVKLFHVEHGKLVEA